MAGPLTWRDVAAPNFGPAMQGYQMFSDLLNNAFSSAERGLAKYDSQRNDAANRVAMFNAMTEQDPEQLKSKLASGELFKGIDLARLSPETIAAADSRVNTLLNRDLSEENLNFTRFSNDKAKTKEASRQAARDAVAARANAYMSGDPAAIKASDEAYNKALAGLPFEDILPTQQGIVGLRGSVLNNSSTEQRLSQDKTLFDRGTLEYNEGRQAMDIANQIISRGGDVSDIDRLLPEYKISGTTAFRVRSLAAQYLPASLGGGGVPMPSGNGADGAMPASGIDPVRQFNYAAKGKGYESMPASVQTLGQASDYQADMNRKGIKETAFGLYQMVGSTLRSYAPAALGSNWRNQPLTAENQDAIARKVFEDPRHRNASAMKKQWVALQKYSDDQVNQIIKMPWEQAREFITQGESGVSAAAVLAGQAPLANTIRSEGAASQFMSNNADSVANQIGSAMTQTRPPLEVARDVKNNFLPDAPTSDILARINDIKNLARTKGISLSNDAAAIILQNSVRPKDLLDSLPLMGGKKVGDGLYYDRDAAEDHLTEFASGDTQKLRVGNERRKFTEAQIMTLEAKQVAAAQNLERVMAQARNKPNFDPRIIQRAQQEYVAAVEAYSNAINQDGNSIAAVQTAPGRNAFGPVNPSSAVNNALNMALGITSQLGPLSLPDRPAPKAKPKVQPKPAPSGISARDRMWMNALSR